MPAFCPGVKVRWLKVETQCTLGGSHGPQGCEFETKRQCLYSQLMGSRRPLPVQCQLLLQT